MKVRILADDLTGALDSAAAFSGPAAFPVYLKAPPRLGVGFGALDLHCRDVGEADAVLAVFSALEFIADGDIAFLKIDSLLRGHEAAMLAALWRSGRFRHCILAPAFPSQGRITEAGRQWARGPDEEWRPVPKDLGQALAERGVGEIEVLDASTDADLRALVAKGRFETLAGPVLAVIGSHHPIMRAQLDHLDRVTGVRSRFLRGVADEAAQVTSSLETSGVVIQASIAPESTPEIAARRIGAVLRLVLPRVFPPGTLIASGGETLREICEALDAERLDVVGAVEAGIPVSQIVGGPWHGVTIVSKSGGFGSVDIMTRLYRMVKSFDAG
jgi:uncharacterized protein YgbK (DUF1537 family)